MRITSILFALVGLGVAAGSAQMARDLLVTPAATASSEKPDLVTIVTTSKEISRGDVLQAQHFTTQVWPRSALPVDAFTELEDLLPPLDGQPRRALRSMVAGEVVLASKVSDFGEKVTIVQSITPGARAMSIKVDAVTAVGGLVTPGDFVDILLTRGDDATLVTDTIMRKVKVLAVDQSSDELNEVPEIAATVTVEVTPEEGQVLALAQRAGSLSLALRTPGTAEGPPIERLRLSDLVPEPTPPAPEPVVVEAAPVVAVAPAPPPRKTVVIRRGTDAEEEVTLRN
jgi:pilus assembly protein CpaB